MGRTGGVILLALTTFAALGAFVIVSARTLERIDSQLAEAGLDFVLGEVRQTIERNLQLGLPLSELEHVEPLLERARAVTAQVVALDVLSHDGTTLFSTDRGAVGEPVPPSWLAAVAEQRTRTRWRARDGGTVTLGTALTNDFETVEGWLAITVEAQALSPPLSRVPPLIAGALPAMSGAALLAAAFGALLTRRREARLTRARAVLDARAPTGAAADDPVGAVVDAAVRRTAEASAALADADAALRRLDAEV